MFHGFLALMLLPLLWAVVRETALLFPRILAQHVSTWWLYGLGATLYLFIERFLARPMWLYVFGHELTHAVSGVLSGAKIHSFRAKSTGGEVRLSKSNAFIAISPYIVPLYAVMLIGIYAVTRHWWNPPSLEPLFQALLGAALAFHISLTVSAIHKHQTDLKVLGFFLSGVLIVMGNALILGVLSISLFSKTPRLSSYAKNIGVETAIAWKSVARLSWWGTTQAVQFIKDKPWTR